MICYVPLMLLEEIMDKHPKAKIPQRISTLIGKQAKGFCLQGL
jgi:hypothetical protein